MDRRRAAHDLRRVACAELASALPRTGGLRYLTESYSPAAGFLWGWAMFWSMHTGIIAAIAMVFARYAGVFVPMSDWGLRLTAVALILLLSAINIVGVKHGGRVQTIFTLAKVAAIVLMIAAGAWLTWGHPMPAAPDVTTAPH